MNAPAPIAVFAYNRPEHTRRVLESLQAAAGFEASRLHVFCDGPRTPADTDTVLQTRAVVREAAAAGAQITERDANLGLAASIIGGVSALCESHGSVIVIEDDLILSPNVLRYLDGALARYRDEERVMHLAAYMFPVSGRLPEAFFYREATCWGWATWARAWRYFEPDPEVIQAWVRQHNAVSAFNINDTMFFWEMLEKQRRGDIDSWAIRWYGSMFMQGGLALHPGESFVQNGGFDGTGVHCSITDRFDVRLSDRLPALPDRIAEHPAAVDAMMAYRKAGSVRPLMRRLWDRTRHHLGVLR
jgi:GT2 family glycosyltransferase